MSKSADKRAKLGAELVATLDALFAAAAVATDDRVYPPSVAAPAGTTLGDLVKPHDNWPTPDVEAAIVARWRAEHKGAA